MTTLREEIEFELCELLAERLTTETILNRIMEKIEKRIDSEFMRASSNPSPEPNIEMYGYLNGLLKVKEMLK